MDRRARRGAASSAVERLWSLEDARGIAANDAFEASGRLDAELGYGAPRCVAQAAMPCAPTSSGPNPRNRPARSPLGRCIPERRQETRRDGHGNRNHCERSVSKHKRSESQSRLTEFR